MKRKKEYHVIEEAMSITWMKAYEQYKCRKHEMTRYPFPGITLKLD